MSPPSIWKLPPKHSHFAETRSISLMQAAGTRIPLIERKGYLRSPIRNEVEHSAKKILAECSTRWPSAQYFRSIIQPNYHMRNWNVIRSEPGDVPIAHTHAHQHFTSFFRSHRAL